jgi:hypothetical protein
MQTYSLRLEHKESLVQLLQVAYIVWLGTGVAHDSETDQLNKLPGKFPVGQLEPCSCQELAVGCVRALLDLHMCR